MTTKPNHVLIWGARSPCANETLTMPGRDPETSRQFLRMADLLIDKGYHLGPKIGEGAYAKVRIVERRKDGKIMAAKIVNRNKAESDFLQRFLPRELSTVLRVDHAYLITTHEIIQQDNFVFLIMDYAERGDLLNHIRKNGAICENDAKKMFWEFAQAINYLHSKDIAHRDLKCENILVMRNKSIAITDFGFSRSTCHPSEPKKPILSSTFCGSASYASPQLLMGMPYDPKANDVWSMGCILYIMLCASMPYDDLNVRLMVQTQLTEKVRFPSRVQDTLQEDCKEFVWNILEPDVYKRMSVEKMLEYDWLKGHQKSVN